MDYLLISLAGLCCLTINQVECAYDITTATNLYTAITFNYNTNLRPSETVDVSLTLTIDSINYLDFDKQTLSVDGWITATWNDTRFNWNPSTFGDINYMFLTKATCWRPTLIIDNELNDKGVLNDDNMVLRVKYDSQVTWDQQHVFSVFCKLDATLFPFDKQECFITISSVGYDAATVSLAYGVYDKITLNIEQNPEWSLDPTILYYTENRTDSSGGLSFSQLRFRFELQRNRGWYVINILVPLVVTSFLGLGVFFIPVEGGEKIVYTSTVLVVNAILNGIAAYFLPTSSGSATLLGIYMLCNLTLNGVEIILTIVSLRIHRKHSRFKAVPVTIQAPIKAICNCFRSDDEQTREVLDLTSDDKKKSHALKTKFSMKSQNKVGPSPLPTTTGYQRMQSGSDSSPSVEPEMDGRTNLPSNSRYRPSSYTHSRPPTSQQHERPSSYTPIRPMSMKSVGGIHIREKSFVTEDISASYQADINTLPVNEPEVVNREEAVLDVTSDPPNGVLAGTASGTGNELEKKASEKSNKQTPSKATSFRSNRERDDREVSWTEVAQIFDMLCFIVMLILVITLTVVVFKLFTDL